MIVLGVCGGHDANWCVVRDGELLGAFEKERYTRRRHDGGEVVSLIRASLDALGVALADVDAVATSKPVHRDTESGLRFLGGESYRRPDEWRVRVVECLGRILPCVSVPHHLAHAAYARYTSEFPSAAVITWDGGGDFFTEDAYTSTSVSSWQGPRLEWLERIDNSDLGSLWFTYARAIFGDGNAAGKLMGLAATGSDALVEELGDRFLVPVQGTFAGAWTVRNCWPEHYWPPWARDRPHWSSARARDLAAAIQAATLRSGLSLAEKVREVTGRKHLALSGGVALNGYLNEAIRRSGLFDAVFVPPAVHDGGLAVGCALFAAHQVFELPWPPPRRGELVFNGGSYGAAEVESALAAAGLSGTALPRDEAEARVADALVRSQTVAWYEGRAEHGPRALGHRSLLSLPDSLEMRDRVNARLKFREPFRPLAPMVLVDEVERYFEFAGPSPYMSYIAPVRPAVAASAPAAVHVDGTARLQTVERDSSMGRILERVAEQTGVGLLLNTSFNVQAPIVETPRDAIETFRRVPIDLLYLDGTLVERPM